MRVDMAITCLEAVPLSDNYFEGQLDLEQSKALHRHLSECEDCLQHFVAYQLVLLVLQREKFYFRRTGQRYSL